MDLLEIRLRLAHLVRVRRTTLFTPAERAEYYRLGARERELLLGQRAALAVASA